MATTKQREVYLKKTYGLSPSTYACMLAFNNGLCHICDRKPKIGKHHCVDHCHTSLEIRGLCCFYCNKYILGRRRREHAHLFKRAYEYLSAPNRWGKVPIAAKVKRRRRRNK